MNSPVMAGRVFAFITGSLLLMGCAQKPEQALGRPVALLVLGDSLSAAHGMDETQGWVHLLEAKWRQEDFLGPGQSIINASKSGETTQGGMNTLPALLDQHNPSHVFIELGANDALRKRPVAETVRNLEAMIAAAQAAGAKVAIADIDLPTSWKFVGGSAVEEAVEQVSSNTGVEVIEFPLAWAASEKGMMMGDNIHPSALAQPFIAEQMNDELVEFTGTP